MANVVKVGIVGLGPRAEVLLAAFLRMDDMEVIAVCDLYEDRVTRAADATEKAKRHGNHQCTGTGHHQKDTCLLQPYTKGISGNKRRQHRPCC